VSPKPVVYVHGAGPQQPAPAFKHELDQILFGRDMPTTRVGYYADVRWPPGRGAAGPAAAAGVPRQRRSTAIRRAAEPGTSVRRAANEILGTTFGGAGGAGTAGGGGVAAPPDPARVAAARKLVEQLYRRADRVATISPVVPHPGVALAPPIPDPIFRFIVGRFACDVLDYLYGSFAEAMRAPVRAALLMTPTPKVVVAHSLGTIVTYDVLSEPALAGLDVELLVTLGCPLGIRNVQDRLRDGMGRPHPVPPEVRSWSNFADRFDPVALEASLRDEFEPPKDFARDQEVNNPARNNHDLTGYASISVVRAAIAAAAG
jgi:hypothetical protein